MTDQREDQTASSVTLREIPDPKIDLMGYTRHFLEQEITDLGSRTLLDRTDLTDAFVGRVVELGRFDWGNAVSELSRQKRETMDLIGVQLEKSTARTRTELCVDPDKNSAGNIVEFLGVGEDFEERAVKVGGHVTPTKEAGLSLKFSDGHTDHVIDTGGMIAGKPGDGIFLPYLGSNIACIVDYETDGETQRACMNECRVSH